MAFRHIAHRPTGIYLFYSRRSRQYQEFIDYTRSLLAMVKTMTRPFQRGNSNPACKARSQGQLGQVKKQSFYDIMQGFDLRTKIESAGSRTPDCVRIAEIGPASTNALESSKDVSFEYA